MLLCNGKQVLVNYNEVMVQDAVIRNIEIIGEVTKRNSLCMKLMSYIFLVGELKYLFSGIYGGFVVERLI